MVKERYLITGCSRRLGLYLAHRLLARGAEVFAHYRTRRPAIDELEQAGARVLQADFEDAKSRRAMIQRLLDDTGHLSGIIHNASGYAPSKAFRQGGSEQFEQFFRVHMQAPYDINESLLDKLRANPAPHSNLIHITDIYAQRPQASHHTYCATKAALSSLNASWASALAPKIRVNQIAPGPILFMDEHDEQHRQQVLKQTPLGVEGGLEPIAQAVDYLLNNPYVTGSCVTVDGGRSLAR